MALSFNLGLNHSSRLDNLLCLSRYCAEQSKLRSLGGAKRDEMAKNNISEIVISTISMNRIVETMIKNPTRSGQ